MTIDDNQLSSNIHLKWHLVLWLWQKVEKVVWWSDGDNIPSNWRACWRVCGCGPVSGCQYGLALNECWWWHRLQPPHSNNIICISEHLSSIYGGIFIIEIVNEPSFIRRVSYLFSASVLQCITLRIVESGVTVCMCTRYCRAESRALISW